MAGLVLCNYLPHTSLQVLNECPHSKSESLLAVFNESYCCSFKKTALKRINSRKGRKVEYKLEDL